MRKIQKKIIHVAVFAIHHFVWDWNRNGLFR